MDNATDIAFWSADLEELGIHGSIGLHRVLGLPPSVALSFGVVEAMMHPDDRAAHTDMLTVLRNGRPLKREFRIIGRTRHCAGLPAMRRLCMAPAIARAKPSASSRM